MPRNTLITRFFPPGNEFYSGLFKRKITYQEWCDKEVVRFNRIYNGKARIIKDADKEIAIAIVE